MADGTVGVLESTDATAKQIDNEQLTVATKTVQRQRVRAYGMAAGDEVDGYSTTLGATADLSTANTVVGLLKAIKAAVQGTLTVATHAVTQSGVWTVARSWTLSSATDSVNIGNFPATQPVSGTVTATGPVTDTQLRASAVPVSLATNTPDVTDRAARLLGHVTVDSAPAVTGTVTANQGGAPWSENLTQIAGTALAAKTLPTNADGQVAIPVYVNAQQYATYDVAARNIATGALTANTAKAVLSLEHALASTKTVRLRRIMIHAIQTTALSGLFDVEITRGTAASSAGTAVTPQPRRITDPAAEVVVKSLPTITAATVADNIPAGGFGATTALYSPPVLVYDWQEAGETKPYMLVAGALQSIVINVISTAAHNLTLTVSVDLTEE